MKIKLILVLLVSFNLAMAQEIISKSGTITLKDAKKIEYLDLVENGDFYTLIEKKSNQKFNYPKTTIFKIVDAQNQEIQMLQSNVVLAPTENKPIEVKKNYVEPLSFEGIKKVSFNNQILDKEQVVQKMSINPLALEQYNYGRDLNSYGNTALVIGVVLIGYRVIEVSNYNSSLETTSPYAAPQPQPSLSDGKAIILSGVALIAAGITLKISGKNQVKKSVEKYNNTLATVQSFQPNYSFKINGNGIGLAINF